jgi:hypothetical protein
MALVLLGSTTRGQIVAILWVMCHRQIQVISSGDRRNSPGNRRPHNHRIQASPAHQAGSHDDVVVTPPGFYAFRIQGRLGTTGLSVFPSMVCEHKGGDTVLTGLLEDRSAVFGVVGQIEALGLELVELRRIEPTPR